MSIVVPSIFRQNGGSMRQNGQPQWMDGRDGSWDPNQPPRQEGRRYVMCKVGRHTTVNVMGTTLHKTEHDSHYAVV